jgi:ADP-heptose:LPS heptosyltransferase
MRSWFKTSRRQTAQPRAVRPLARYRYVRLRWRLLFALVDAIGWSVVGLLRAVPTRSPVIRSILLVQLDHLGDAILSTGLLRGLRGAYPEARIDVLASPANAEFFELLVEVDRVFVSRVTRFGGGHVFGWIWSMLHWGWRLRRQAYDLAIDARGDFPAAVILRLCGAPVRLGWGSGGGGFLLTHQADFVWGRHEVLSRQALLHQLGIAPPDAEPAWPPLVAASSAAREAMHQTLDPTRPLMVLHVGAGTSAKRWSAEHWRELIGRLLLADDLCIVLVGSAAEGQCLGAFRGLRNWCGKLSIDELTALIERADLLIGGDSAPAHLAAAVGTPALVLFSGTNRPEQWRPWGQRVRVLKHVTACSPCHRHHCPLADHPCLSGLPPATVLAAAQELLAISTNTQRRPLERTAV